MGKKRTVDADWQAVRAEMRGIMIDVARMGTTITYSELCAEMTLARIHYHSGVLARLLDEIGVEERAGGRPILPAVVVRKQTGIPGPGYFRAEGEFDDPPADAEAGWRRDVQAVYDYWSKH